MSEFNLDLSPDDRLIRFRIRWVEFVLATVSFYIVIWTVYQYLGALGGIAPNEQVLAYRTDWGIAAIRMVQLAVHVFFVQLIIRRAFFPQSVKPNPFWVQVSFLVIVALPWVEQLYAAHYLNDLVVLERGARRLMVLFFTFGYAMLPFWKFKWRRFQQYEAGGKMAGSLTILIVLVILTEYIQ